MKNKNSISPLNKFISLLDYYSLLVPENGKKEKEKFFLYLDKKIKYNPRYEYKKLEGFDYMAIGNEISSYKGKDEILDTFVQLFQQISNLLKSLKEEDCDSVTAISGEIFGDIRSLSIDNLIKLNRQSKLKENNQSKKSLKKYYSGKELINVFQDAINNFKLTKWRIEIDVERLSDVTIDASNKKVIINPSREINQIDLNRLLEHEIKGHIFQGENSSNFHMYSDLFSSYLGNEQQSEGFALFVETNNLDDEVFWSIIKRYSTFMIANYYATKYDFYDTFIQIYDLTEDKELSFLATQRSKRGFKNTDNVGCFQKENSYLIGLKKVMERVFSRQTNLEIINALKFPFFNENLFLNLLHSDIKFRSVSSVNKPKIARCLKILNFDVLD